MVPGFPAGPATEHLTRLLLARVLAHGTVTFAEFMQLALYEPGLGYYARTESPIGTDKDFFTAVSATPLFGRILGRTLRDLRRQLGETSPFCVYEFGSHRGALRDDILSEAPELEYQALEHGDPIPPEMHGCVLSNELVDALPFHRLKVVGGEWKELCVGVAADSGQLEWRLDAPAEPSLLDRIRELPLELMENYETEVSLAGNAWIREVGKRLRTGLVITFDYGFEDREYFAPSRAQGGLRCFHRHQVSRDPFTRLGEQDITADVNFSALVEAGKEVGLQLVTLSEQSRFLVKAGKALIEEVAKRDAGRLSRDRNGLHLLTHPTMLGPRFKVLVQEKRAETPAS